VSNVRLLRDIAQALETAPRQGSIQDAPEGARFITMSDTLARRIAANLRVAALTIDDITRQARRAQGAASGPRDPGASGSNPAAGSTVDMKSEDAIDQR
jgi:hypothetical protein